MNQQLRSVNRRAIWATLFLVTFGVMTVASMVSNIAEIDLLRQLESGYVSQSDLESNDSRQILISLLFIASFIAATVAFLVWIRSASENLAYIGVHGQSFSPGWAVGAWFVPLICLFRPYQIMVEIWKGSYPQINPASLGRWTDSPASPLLGFWWLTWLVSGWIGNFALGFFFSGQTIDDLIRSDIMSVASGAISMASLIMVLILIRQITSNQGKKYANYQALLEAGGIVGGADMASGQDSYTRPSTASPAQPPRNVQCPRCRRNMLPEDLSFGVCGQCRSF